MNHIAQKLIFFAGLFGGSFLFNATAQNLTLTIHLRGVYESKVSVIPLSGHKQFKSIAVLPSIKNNEIKSLQVSNEYLPGEFVLRFEYQQSSGTRVTPVEMKVLINRQDLGLWVNPPYCNNPDSTWFQEDEKENMAFNAFLVQNNLQMEKLGVLQQFLMNYDETESDFYRQGIIEYEKRRQQYNLWIENKALKDSALFASSLYRFNYLSPISWEGSKADRMWSVIYHYFDGIDFNDPIITRSSQLNEWMNNYVNLYGQMATTLAMRDSLIPAAAITAIEKAKKGHPLVYGWMVDYFYRGFESNNFPAGMKTLEPYLNDPNCLTSKRMEIERRLNGMKSLVIGSRAPDISMRDKNDKPFELYTFDPGTRYILLLFWSADCSHCLETADAVHEWQQQPSVKSEFSVVAISLDETETEITAWELRIKSLQGWKHLRANEGIRSKVAGDYYILATPVMVVLNADTKEIIGLPATEGKLNEFIR